MGLISSYFGHPITRFSRFVFILFIDLLVITRELERNYSYRRKITRHFLKGCYNAHFRNTVSLFFKASSGAYPFI